MIVQPTKAHKAFRTDFLKLLDAHAGKLDASEMMALAAYSVGQIMAMQDATKWTSELAMDLVAKNIEMGNAHAISDADKWMPRA
jgi:hypothetical protein